VARNLNNKKLAKERLGNPSKGTKGNTCARVLKKEYVGVFGGKKRKHSVAGLHQIRRST
jgi:hypothetical protein